MKNIALILSSLAFSAAIAGTATAQVTTTGPATSLPQGLAGVVGGAGGLTAGAVVSFVVIGTLLVVTVVNSDGSSSTTTTELAGL